MSKFKKILTPIKDLYIIQGGEDVVDAHVQRCHGGCGHKGQGIVGRGTGGAFHDLEAKNGKQNLRTNDANNAKQECHDTEYKHCPTGRVANFYRFDRLGS